MQNPSVRQEFEQAIEYFNRQFFFECHDILEEIWLTAPAREKNFYQGILHVAVGYYHFDNDNFKGSFSQLTKARERLNSFLPEYRGVNLEDLVHQSEPIRKLARDKLAGKIDKLNSHIFPPIIWQIEKWDSWID